MDIDDPSQLVRHAGIVLATLGGATLIVAGGALVGGSPGWSLELAGAGLLKVAIGAVLAWLAPERPRSEA